MAQHFMQSKAYRDLSDAEISEMTEHEAWQWFCNARWGSSTCVVCPTCNQQDRHYPIPARKQWRCKYCHRHFSVTSETPFAKRRLSFKKLVQLIYWVALEPHGHSSNKLPGRLGVTFRTAWQNMNKIREAIFHAQDRTKMSGVVHVDGGHFCGKPRRPRVRQKMTSDIANNHLKNRKANIIPLNAGYSITAANKERLKKRRILLAIVQGIPGTGSQRTITCVLKAENEQEVLRAIRRNVLPGTLIYTDSGNAYASLTAAGYNHQAVNHSKEYAREDGVNNNWAEATISRLRRAEYGVYNGMRPQYFAFYCAETAWRQDARLQSVKTKVLSLMKCVLSADISQAFRGYAQGHRLGFEYLG
ncbi:IS1595 family transposase [Herbaspirillum huttiense]|uniref:IS1595 family transposase n=1 Tax=Herbaspirillum huttiense TaxID=863372 RepID=UPI0031D633D8